MKGLTKGIKYDGEKLRWDLVGWKTMEDVVKVLMAGAKKYDEYNWCKVRDGQRRYWTAAMRHLIQDSHGERIDSETGETHLAHAICCILFLSELRKMANGYKKETKDATC